MVNATFWSLFMFHWHVIMTLFHINILQNVERECLNHLNVCYCLLICLDICYVLLISFMAILTMLTAYTAGTFTLKITKFVRTRNYTVSLHKTPYLLNGTMKLHDCFCY